MTSITTRFNNKKCPLSKTTSSLETGLELLHYWKVKETSTFKSKTVSGLPTAISTWVSTEKLSTFMTNFWERLTMTTTTFLRPAAIMLFVSMMTQRDKPQSPRMKVHSKPDCSSILHIRKMTKSPSCSSIRNSVKVLRISWLWQQFITWEGIMRRQPRFTKSYCLKVENTKLWMSTSPYVTTRWNTMMWVYKFCPVMKLSTLKASSLQIWRLATIIKFTQARMLRKSSDLSNRNSREEIFSRKAIFWDTTLWFSEEAKTLCKSSPLLLNCSLKQDWTW